MRRDTSPRGRRSPSLLQWRDRDKRFTATRPLPIIQHLVISYLRLRQALGAVAIAMPFVLALGAWLIERIPWADSVSAYYYTSMRDVFVGTMFAIGVFLVCYRGYDWIDNWLTNAAGVAAAAVGLFPMEPHYSKVLIERHRDIAGSNCYVPLWLP